MKSTEYQADRGAEREMVEYLLGELSEQEQAQFEARYFADDALFERLAIIKAELLDSYVRGQLVEADRARVERCFHSTPTGREQLAFARSLRQALNEAQPLPNPPVVNVKPQPARWAFLSWRALGWAAVLLVLAGLGWLFSENRQLRRELNQLRAAQAEQFRREQELQRQLAALRAPTPAPAASPTPKAVAPPFGETFVAIELRPATRSATAETPTVTLKPVTRYLSLKLRLNFNPQPLSCAATLRAPGGAAPARHTGLRVASDQQGFFATLRLAAAALSAGEYQVTLTGTEVKAQDEVRLTYRFQVKRP